MREAANSNIGFVTEAKGPRGIFAVFEDDGETGYLYLYEPGAREVFRHLHVYDRSSTLAILEQDVRVVWADDFSKCGVRIWGEMRGIIELSTGREGRVWLESRDTPGIGDPDWLRGFST